jgi:choline dehydrogenase
MAEQGGATYDYVVVGGGSSGAILAAKLSERSNVSVCLIEAGQRDTNWLFHIPAGFVKVIFDPKCTWGYETQPGPYINDRKLPVIQGRVLGGSGSINGTVYTRGQAEDFDHWAQLGNRGWSYEDILPYFKACERRIGPANERVRGRTGPIPVSDLNFNSELTEAFIAACVAQGIPRNPDYNGEKQEGAGRYQYTIGGRWRFSAARAFLKPAEARSNLSVVTDTLATRLLFDGRRAKGVSVRGPGGARDIFARREVILCCGAVNTPKLLMVSGVGPGAVLQEHAVPIVMAAEGVGRNYQDHFTPRFTYLVKDIDTVNGYARGPKLWGQVARWVMGMPSILSVGAVLGCAYTKSHPDLDRPDILVTFTPGSFKAGFLGRLDDVPGMTTGVWQLRPDSRGEVRIASPSIDDKPLVQPNFLQDKGDQETVVKAMKLARRIMATPEIGRYVVAETMPGPDTASDDDLLAYARKQGLCGYHASGTCKMGPEHDRGAVVDDNLRFRGLEGLRVADASVMPTMVSGNTNAATMMIAAKAADLIGKAA